MMETATENRAFLELCDISVQYGSVKALSNASVSIFPKEVLAVVGEHGAGKSSLGQVICGNIQFGTGSVVCDGATCEQYSADKAYALRIERVSQGNEMFDSLSVALNLFMFERHLFRRFSFKLARVFRRAHDCLAAFGIDWIDPHTSVGDLNLSDRVLVDIIRHILPDPRLLILDEALEKLNAKALAKIIPVLQDLKRKGLAILFITHRIDDIYEFADRVAIIRNGEILTVDSVRNMDKITLIKLAYTQIIREKNLNDATKEFLQLIKYNEAILKGLPVNLIVVDNELVIKLMNDFGRRFFGQRDSAQTVSDFGTLLVPQAAEGESADMIREIRDALLNHRSESFLNLRVLVNGENRTVNILTCPISDQAVWIGNMIIVNDVTTQELLREQFILTEKLASVGILAAGVAHEINNPLEIIYNYLDYLKVRTEMAPMKDIILNLEGEINSIEQIVSNLITFSDVKNLTISDFEVNEILQNLINLVTFNARHRGTEIVFDPKQKAVEICANKNELKQVFLNLMKNSFEAMPEGGRLTITTDIEPGPEHADAVISFEDTGTGIRSPKLTDVFLPFYSTKSGRENNLGLGLSVTWNIVTKHNGSVAVENTLPTGCRFTLRFPAVGLSASCT